MTTSAGDPVATAPSLVMVRIEWPGGQVREYTARHPLGFRQAVHASGESAGLSAGFTATDAQEPVVAVMFAGNPQAGGVQVHSEGQF